MDHLNSLSDQELRQRLLQHGLPNLPVTKTTRNILIRKLRNHMESEQAKLKRATTYATRYSSDEDASDQEAKWRPNTSMPPPKTNNRRMNPPIITKISPRSQSVYVSPVVRHLNTDSEDDTDHQSSITSSLSSSLSRRSIRLGPPSPIPRTSTSTSLYPTSFISSFDRSNEMSVSQPRDQTATTNGHSSDYLHGISTTYRRSALSTSTPSPRRSTQTMTTSASRTRHLNETFATAPSDADAVYQADHSATSVSVGTTLSHFLTKLNEQFSIILGLFVVFFAVVVFMYISIRPDLASTVNVQEAVYSLCSFDHPDSNGVVCVNKEDLNATLDLIKLTATELQRRMELNKCKDASIPFTMSAKEVLNNAMLKSTKYPLMALVKDLHNMEYMIKMNPQWSIANCDASGHNLSFDDVIELRKTRSNYFVILKPRLPLMCSLSNKMGVFFSIIGWIGLISVVAYGIYYIYRIIMNVIQSKRDKKNLLIADIITAIVEKAEDDPTNPQVVVNHLRDKLLASPSRANWEWAWDQAIDYLENHDSRIKFEIGCRNGEDCRLMKWVDTAATSSGAKRAFAKKWQCSAYDKLNKIKDPPTQCLKIRQMFEKHEVNNPNLKQVITDALLEKAENKCKIHDIELDLHTCCVYVRCATPADAGMVHDLVNGWWFDGRLVSIKFLRIDRYMSRFPHSTGVGFLQPSNTNNSSMTYYVEESGRARPQGADDD